jgi:hypothetical protein
MRRTVYIAFGILLCLLISVLSMNVLAGTSTNTQNGNQYYATVGDTGPSSAYPSFGIMLGGYLTGGGAAWAFAIYTAPHTYDFSVTLYYTDNALLGNGPDILMYNWTSSAWDTIATAMGQGTNIYRTASPTASGFGCENYISASGYVDVEAWAGWEDDTDVGTISITWTYDSTPPSNPSSFTSVPAVDTWTTDNTVEVQWSGASDNTNGIGGYSIQWTQSLTTVPDIVVDTTGTATTSSALADGVWYLHIRTVDGVGNWNAGAYHIGPFRIDATAPGLPVVTGPPTWSNDNTPQFSWSAPSDLSGVAGYSYSVDNPPDDSVDTLSASITTSTLSDGSHQFFVKAVDVADNWGLPALYSFSIDTVAPSGSITISSGAIYANTTSVVLGLTGSDSLSGVNQIRFSNDNSSWSGWQDFSITKAWTLTVGDGTKTVYYQISDNAGTVSTYSDTIVLDTTKPTGSVVIQGGSAFSNTTAVDLTLAASDVTSGVNQVRFSNNNLTWTSWQAFATPKAWTLSPGDGTKTVYFQVIDNAGLVKIYSDVVILDTTAPTGTMTIGDGAIYSKSTSVTLSLSAVDSTSGVAQMRFCDDNSAWTAWESYSASRSWNLPSGDGSKQVFVQYVDYAGLVSSTYSASVILDTTAPSLSFEREAGTTLHSSSPEISWSCSDVTSGVERMEYSLDRGAFSDIGNATHVNLTDVKDGSHEIIVRATDVAGNAVEQTLPFNVDTNLMSFSGPMGPWLDVGIIIVVLAAVVLAVVLLRRKGKSKPSSPENGKPA